MSRLLLAVAVLLALAAAPAAAHPSRAIVVDRDGDIYFSDLLRVWRLSGDRLQLVRDSNGAHTHGMIVDAAGAIVWEESRYDPADGSYVETVWQVDNGRLRRRFGPLRNPALGLGIARDRRGCTYRVNQIGAGGSPLVHRLCPGRSRQRLLGTADEEARYRPELINDVAGIAFAPNGSFVFRQGKFIRSIDDSGRVRTLASGVAAENFGIAVDARGALLVVEHGRRRILRLDRAGRRIAASSSAGWRPTGVAARGRSLLILESSDYRPGASIRMRVREAGAGRSDRVLALVTVPQG